MAYVSQSFAQITLADRFATATTSVRTFFARRAEFARVANELHSMTDYDLADIAVSRADIKTIAKEAAQAL